MLIEIYFAEIDNEAEPSASISFPWNICDFASVCAGGVQAQGKRVALVIGNSAYVSAAKLDNPINDAEDMAATLERLGFAVLKGTDLSKAGMDAIIRQFAEAMGGAKAGLLFYAGHGLQVGGQNYLVPIDAKLTTSSALDFEMVRLELIQRAMERETSTNIIILDACRDNPLAWNLARALGTRSSQIGHGLPQQSPARARLSASRRNPEMLPSMDQGEILHSRRRS